MQKLYLPVLGSTKSSVKNADRLEGSKLSRYDKYSIFQESRALGRAFLGFGGLLSSDSDFLMPAHRH